MSPSLGKVWGVIAPFAPETRGHVTRLASPSVRAPTLRRSGTGKQPTSELHSFGLRPAEGRPERDGVTSYAGRSAPGRPLIGSESSQSWAGLKTGLHPLPLNRSRGL